VSFVTQDGQNVLTQLKSYRHHVLYRGGPII